MVDMKIADRSRWSDQFHKTNITTKKKQGQIKLGDEFRYKEQKSQTKIRNRKDEFELQNLWKFAKLGRIIRVTDSFLFTNTIYILKTSRENRIAYRIVYVHRDIVPASKPRSSALGQSSDLRGRWKLP